MHNLVYLIGRLVENPELKEIDENKHVVNITIAVVRSYKNENGEYETDFIRCTLWNNIAKNVTEYCKKGDLVGVKGRLESSRYEDKNGDIKYNLEVVVEKISFLSSKKD